MTFLRLIELATNAAANVATVQRLLGVWGPIGNGSAILGPLLAIGSILMLALLSGVAVGALATLLVASLLLFYLLTEVFGVSVEFVLPA